MSDDDRNAILRRRRFFIATAVAGLAATHCDNEPKVCLNISEVRDGSTIGPTVCLSPPPTPPDASTPEMPTIDAGTDSSALPDAGAKRPTTVTPPATTGPRVCLTPLRKPDSER